MRRAIVRLAVAAAMMLPAVAQAQTAAPAFTALDLSGGYSSRGIDQDDEQLTMGGWNASATLRVLPWLGFKADVARLSNDAGRQSMYVGGVAVTSEYFAPYMSRVFAHAMAGTAGGSFHGAPVPYGPAFVTGAGFDFLGFGRFQVDYVRADVAPGQSPHGVRGMIGGVVPLCFRGCRGGAIDGIDLSRTRKKN